MKIYSCHDCAVEEGELHLVGCDNEKCPICKGQLLHCSHDWNDLEDKQREPFFIRSSNCKRCGDHIKEMFMVGDPYWKKVCGITYDRKCILCKGCMEFIIKKRNKLEVEKND